MIITEYHNNPSGFVDDASDFLRANETENNLIIGVAEGLRADPVSYVYKETYFWVVREGDAIQGCAMMTPPYDLVLAYDWEEETLDAFAEYLHEKHISLPGVLGPSERAAYFYDLWADKIMSGTDPWRRERLYRLDSVESTPPVKGQMIPTGYKLKSLVVQWIREFNNDTGEEGNAEAAADRFISGRSLYVWEDTEPVSMAAWMGATGNCVRISMVYTPPESRNRGYATSLVRDLSSKLLSEGYRYCALYTDLSNPVSNSIYQKIGYRPVMDFYHYKFS